MSDIMAQAGDAEQPDGISRRTVLKGAAWSVPAIMVATQLPAAAQMAGTPPEIEIDFGDSGACKIPGNSLGPYCYDKGYVLWATIVNNGSVPLVVTAFPRMIVGGVAQCIVGVTDVQNGECLTFFNLPITVPAAVGGVAGEYKIGIFSNASTDSQNTDITVDIAYNPEGNSGDQRLATTSGSLNGDPWSNTNNGGGCRTQGNIPDECNIPNGGYIPPSQDNCVTGDEIPACLYGTP
jgi:hypothetical protein